MNAQPRKCIRRNFETFLCWYIPVWLVAAIITGFGIPYAIREMALRKESAISMESLMWFSSASTHFTGVVAGVWLWKEQRQRCAKSRILWAIFGLASSLWAVGLYLLVDMLAQAKASSGDH